LKYHILEEKHINKKIRIKILVHIGGMSFKELNLSKLPKITLEYKKTRRDKEWSSR